MGLEEILALGPGSAALIEQLRLLCGTREVFDAVLAGLFRDVTADAMHDLQEFDDPFLMRLENDGERKPLIRLRRISQEVEGGKRLKEEQESY